MLSRCAMISTVCLCRLPWMACWICRERDREVQGLHSIDTLLSHTHPLLPPDIQFLGRKMRAKIEPNPESLVQTAQVLNKGRPENQR